MIDITSQHLDRLRSTFSNASDELTKQEIRTLEGKLVKHFSEQLAVKYGLGPNTADFEYFPSLSQWLQVVGVSSDTKDAITQRVRSLEDLKDKTECELKRILLTASRVPPATRHQDLRRLCRSLHNLRKYTDVLVYGRKQYGPGGDPSKLELYWDSWDVSQSKSECSSPKHSFSLPPRLVHISSDTINRSAPLPAQKQSRAADSTSSSLSSSSSAPPPSPGCSTLSPPSISDSAPRGPLMTPPATPPWVVLAREKTRTTSSTPPASKKLSTGTSPGTKDLSVSLSKSKSHESELSHRIDYSLIVYSQADVRIETGELIDTSGYSSASEAPNSSRRRLHSADPEGGSSTHSDYQGPSPVASPKSPSVTSTSVSSSLQVPRSPRTPGTVNIPSNRQMGHMISHRFTKTFKPARCMYCQEIFFQGMKCKECKFRCHTHCQSLVPPSCGLPEDLLQHFMDQLASDGSPILPRAHQHNLNQPPFHSSSSSCNSSTPSSPQVIVTSHATSPWSTRSGQHFRFPETTSVNKHMSIPKAPVERVVSPNPLVDTVKSNDSDKTLSGSSDSIGTAYRLDSQDSTTSVEGECASTWSSGRQMSIREWDIPYEELKILDKIGSGRFSTVHKGHWHGDVAIKFLDMENLEDETTLEAFRLDVATFRKTRHENLVLFMGACMKPPRLAIVTALCKGNTLYTHLHLRKDKFFMNKIILMAQQIALGMGYLHHKGIVHKDLKTKNIFLENGRAIISDFGLVNVARRLCSRHKRPGDSDANLTQEYMSIPAGWLCYLAPEVIRELRVHQTSGEDLPFTRASDVYAFGTVWYELLTGEWPWRQQHPESIIWQAGRGIKPTLANLQASRDVKDVLVQCWLFNSVQRPDFSALLQILEKIPKKRLARSPSHPIHLSRSAESVF